MEPYGTYISKSLQSIPKMFAYKLCMYLKKVNFNVYAISFTALRSGLERMEIHHSEIIKICLFSVLNMSIQILYCLNNDYI